MALQNQPSPVSQPACYTNYDIGPLQISLHFSELLPSHLCLVLRFLFSMSGSRTVTMKWFKMLLNAVDRVHNLVIFMFSSWVYASMSMGMGIDMLVNVHTCVQPCSHLRSVSL